jgi:hypothetical protein
VVFIKCVPKMYKTSFNLKIDPIRWDDER